MPEMQAKTSLSKAEYLICAGSRFLEQNARGCQAPEGEERCCRAAPTWSAEASSINANSWSCCRYASNGAGPRAVLAASKAATMGGDLAASGTNSCRS